MSATFKVQRIRSCVQCGDVLGLKCKSCLKHPDRKPVVVEFFDWPEILKVAECGCCILIACQAPGCVNRMWRHRKHERGGLTSSRSFICSPKCGGKLLHITRSKRQQVPCAYCSKLVTKKQFTLKSWVRSFCNNSCYFLFRAKAKHEAQQAAKAKDAARALLWCEKCKDVTEHDSPNIGSAKCLPCARPLEKTR